jgi:hypothetical protein
LHVVILLSSPALLAAVHALCAPPPRTLTHTCCHSAALLRAAMPGRVACAKGDRASGGGAVQISDFDTNGAYKRVKGTTINLVKGRGQKYTLCFKRAGGDVQLKNLCIGKLTGTVQPSCVVCNKQVGVRVRIHILHKYNYVHTCICVCVILSVHLPCPPTQTTHRIMTRRKDYLYVSKSHTMRVFACVHCCSAYASPRAAGRPCRHCRTHINTCSPLVNADTFKRASFLCCRYRLQVTRACMALTAALACWMLAAAMACSPCPPSTETPTALTATWTRYIYTYTG